MTAPKNRISNTLDYTNSLTEGFNEQNKAFDTVSVNSLVPVRYGKVLLTYINTPGCSRGKIETAKYYSNGVYQETRIITRGNELGSAHKTTVSFIHKTSTALSEKALVLFDSTGGVVVWFRVNGVGILPVVPNTYRDIPIDILSTDDHETVAKKASIKLNMDAAFISIYSSYFIIVSSSSVGPKSNSYDFNTQMYVKNTSGTSSKTLNNTIWFLNSAGNAEEYYLWHNVNGGGTDPLIPGKIGLMVAIPTTSNSSQVATATKTALDSTGKFLTNRDKDTLLISNVLIGASTSIQYNTSEFLIFVAKEGESRELLVTLFLTYNGNGDIDSVERL